ncbi:MAG: HAMP domain-containing histidine kinase [Gammaproteobacteria bacterium]|nr:HAMP domain-containing histidine kinase [Gammaproteobacteria bacterium]
MIGFCFAVLPLLVAVAYAAVYMDRLAKQSQQAVYQAAKATQTSRTLVEILTRLERAGRQYQILGDAALLKGFQENHELFEKAADSLLEFQLDKSMHDQLQALIKIEVSVYLTLTRQDFNSAAAKNAVEKFAVASELARKVLAGSNRVIDTEVQVLHDMAATAQNQFVWVGLTLIPTIIIIVIAFSIILSRPIRQIDYAIKTLGSGVFNEPVYVTGPEDLQYLGQRLDWLRMRLAEVEEEKAKFVRHVSHELKTPLTAIREGADLLDDGVVGNLNQRQRQVVEILVSNTSKLQQLIEDLLNFSAAHTKITKLNNEQVQLDKLIHRVINDQKLAIMAKKLHLKTKLEPIAVSGDKEMLRVVIDNLMSNAVKYSPLNGRLAIAVQKVGLDAKVDIIDDGPGISDAEKHRVFDAFFQGKAKPTGHIKGTGVGLSIVKEFIQAHGGYIEVTDNQPTGAHMSLRLPLQSYAEEAPIVDEDRLRVF